MRAIISASRRFFEEIWSDAMLTALAAVPLIMGLAFRFGVPLLESYLCAQFNRAQIMSPYYAIFDLLLSIMTPVMFTASGAMVILDEADFGIARAISITPAGRTGYLASRIAIPALFATVYCVVVTLIFRLSAISTGRLLLLAVCSGALGVAAALMISSLAKNKVEGLAFSKLSGMLVLGLPASLLLPSPYKYALAFLPSFWMTELATGGGMWLAIPALLSAALLSAIFALHFQRKLLS